MWEIGVILASAVVIMKGAVAMEIGVSKRDLVRPNRIVGGTTAPAGSFEWQVSLQTRRSSFEPYRHFCGGALVDKNWVVTATHCVQAVDMGSVVVVMGTKNLNAIESMHPAKEWYTHPEYDPKTMENDIALIKINTKINLISDKPRGNPMAAPISLAMHREVVNSDYIISGFGRTSYGGHTSDALLYAKVKGIDDDECRAIISNHSRTYKTFESQLCAGGDAADACQGDSGGPIASCDRGMPMTPEFCRLAGVTSWGILCATPGVPGIYTEIAYFETWLSKIMSGKK